jgi:GNAT superfamily N-acetyltransferase
MTSSDLPRLRLAEAADAARIAEIFLRARADAMPWLARPHTDDEVGAWVAGTLIPAGGTWVAERATRVVAYATLAGGMLTQLYVDPAAQGSGVGSVLLAHAKTLSPDGLELYAFQRNRRARQFYEERGFVAVAFGDGADNEEREPDVRYAWRRPAPQQGACLVE